MPAIDGLRAIAVLAVLAFHLNPNMLPGGFVGVDVFFVISGFLIGSILLDDLDQGRFSLAGFYQRRIARIFPVFAVALAVVLAAGFAIFNDRDLGRLGHDTAFAALSLANFNALSAQYGTMLTDDRPLTHFWSLAVEEQFYVLFPLYVYFAVRVVRRPVAITVIATLLSFAFCLYLSTRSSTYAFYLLPPRGWELLAGTCLALIGRMRSMGPGVGRQGWIAPIGLLLVLASLALTPLAGFPGWTTLIPVLGTVMILSGVGDEKSRIVRTLASRILAAIGKLSYSLYLWHWPVFGFVDYRLYTGDAVTRTTLKLVLTFALSAASYALLERPLRRYLAAPERRAVTFGGFALVSALLCVAGTQIAARYEIVPKPPTIAEGGVTFDGPGPGRVMLIGDSFATMYATELVRLGERRGFTLNVLSEPATAELPGGRYWPAVLEAAGRMRPDVIVLSHRWIIRLKRNPARLGLAIAQLRLLAGRIIVLAQPPALPLGGDREGMRLGARPPFFEPADLRNERHRSDRQLRAVAGGNVDFFAVEPYVLARDGSVGVFDAMGRLIHADVDHLNEFGTRPIVAGIEPLIVAAIAARQRERPGIRDNDG